MSTTRRLGCRCIALAAIVGVVVVDACVPAADGAPLQRLAGTISGFAVDGQRWAIWQLRRGGPVEVLDSSDGHLRTVASAGCSVPPPEEAEIPQLAPSDGAFLLECASNTYAALYARTGRVQLLPAGYDWRRIGSLYAEEGAKGCEEPCHTTIIDLATGALSVRGAPRIYELDRPGAPALPICARLRQGVHTVLEAGEEVGVYQPGMFVHEVFERSTIVIERCNPPQTTLHPESDPRDLQLGDGLLSWDTGLPPREEGPEENAVLTAYSLRYGSQRSWPLPLVSVKESVETPARLAIWGYSAHAGDTLFWEAVTEGEYTFNSWVATRFALYAVRL
jgi:hypothetical protein